MFLLALFAVPMVVIAIAIRLTSSGPILHWSKRVGRMNRIFLMPKFRTMRTSTPQVATDLLRQPGLYVTSVGGWLRRSSLDELPQLFSVLRGELSLVGPRPALFNQHDLAALRTQCGVHLLQPGITGWAQVNGRDCLKTSEKVSLDHAYMQSKCWQLDLRILAMTVARVVRRNGISH